MQAAKDVVKKFTSKDGHHDTTVHETVNPAVTNETVHQQQEERVHRAVDKEVHQDHYHTSVQPVHDKEILPEQHHHRAAEVEHRSFEHGDHAASKDLHAREAAKFHDQSTRVQGETTQTAQPVVGAEHTHHHVHEQIQPVIHKQTIEPHVVHTTQPIHETHHNAAKHHQTSTLPAVGLNEFTQGGGVLSGRGEKSDAFEGCPKGAHSGTAGSTTGTHSHTTGTHSHTTGGHSHTTGGDRDSALTDKLNSGSHTSSSHTGAAGVGGGGAATGATGATGTGNNYSSTTGSSTTGSSTTGTHQKPSLMDKLNPKKDADGDGKPGFMK